MKINNSDDLIKYITKYKDNAKKMSKIKKNFKKYLELCNAENIMLFINQVKKIPETIKQDNPLKKGDLVIIDTDFLYREQDFDEKLLDSHINTDFYQICEQRYQKEKNSSKINRLIRKTGDIIER